MIVEPGRIDELDPIDEPGHIDEPAPIDERVPIDEPGNASRSLQSALLTSRLGVLQRLLCVSDVGNGPGQRRCTEGVF